MITSNKHKKIKQHTIDINTSILNALKKMDSINSKLLIITKDNKFKSLLSIGDIQRSIIKDRDFEAHVGTILRPEISYCSIKNSTDSIKSKMLKYRSAFMPILDLNKDLFDVIFWEELFEDSHTYYNGKLDIPVVIMAGGEGTRLKPLTNIIPKPLIPLGDKPIIQIIADSFLEMGTKKFYFSVNYKSDFIKYYFNQLPEPKYNIKFFTEDKPLGTAGSLHLIRDEIKSTFFVSNCDILIDQDYEEIYKYHTKNKNELTLVAAIKNYSIPYGTVDIKEDGLLDGLKEKPELTFMINAGMYILEPHLLDEIPINEFFHITHLMEKIKKRGGRVGVFPVSEGAWLDIGEWKEYNKTQEIFSKKFKGNT